MSLVEGVVKDDALENRVGYLKKRKLRKRIRNYALKNVPKSSRVYQIREFKQIATAGADTAAGSKFPQKCGTAHVRRLHPTVARNLTT